MRLINSRGVRAPRWLSDEMVHINDLQVLAQAMYENAADLLVLTSKRLPIVDDTNYISFGLRLLWQSALTCKLEAGALFSTQGTYSDVLGSFDFTDSAGDVFAVFVPVDTLVAFDGGDASDRIDIIEVRPIRVEFDSQARPFRDPLTRVVTTIATYTKYSFEFEYQIIKGTAGSGVAPAATVGWCKLAEVTVPASASAITQSNIKDARDSASWTTAPSTTMYDLIKDYMVDWGTGADQVSAADVPIEDASSLTASTEVEASLQELLQSCRAISPVAGESITAADLVGYANEKLYRAIFAEHVAKTAASASTGTETAIAYLGTNQFVVGYNDAGDGSYTHVRVGEYTDSAINWLTSRTQVDGANVGTFIRLANVGGGRFAVVWYRAATGIYARCGTYSGGTITWDAAVTQVVASGTAPATVAIAREGSVADKWVVLYNITGAVCHIRECAYSGGTITVSAATAIDTTTTNTCINPTIAAVDDMAQAGSFIVVWRDGTTGGNPGKIRAGYYSGGSLTWYFTETTWQAVTNYPVIAYLGGGYFAVAFHDSTSPATSYTIVGRLFTNGVRWTSAQVPAGNVPSGGGVRSLIHLGGGYLVHIYSEISTTYLKLEVLQYWRGMLRMVYAATTINGVATVQAHLGVMLRQNIVAVAIRDSDNLIKVLIWRIPTWLGVALESKSAGNAVLIQAAGAVNNQSSLSLGRLYYASYSSATPSLAATGERVGMALTSTKLLLDR